MVGGGAATPAAANPAPLPNQVRFVATITSEASSTKDTSPFTSADADELSHELNYFQDSAPDVDTMPRASSPELINEMYYHRLVALIAIDGPYDPHVCYLDEFERYQSRLAASENMGPGLKVPSDCAPTASPTVSEAPVASPSSSLNHDVNRQCWHVLSEQGKCSTRFNPHFDYIKLYGDHMERSITASLPDGESSC
jgi:hypothetical protein